MSNLLTNCIIGGASGFVYFVVKLEASDSGNILFRIDSTGNKVFRPDNLVHYIKSVFTNKYLWYPSLWKSNWIITTTTGVVIGAIAGPAIGAGLGYIINELVN